MNNKTKKKIQSILFNRNMYSISDTINILRELNLQSKKEPIITNNVIWYTNIPEDHFNRFSLTCCFHPAIRGVELIRGIIK